jgi:sterol desaturase/sphingolipid hydroxylase (fatty acid hydroxylase superfamily)
VRRQDVNFAVHLPWLDRLFGSHHLPAHDWPAHYGLADGQRGPRGFWRQLLTLPGTERRGAAITPPP